MPTFTNRFLKFNRIYNDNYNRNDILDSYLYKSNAKTSNKNSPFSLQKQDKKKYILKTEPRKFIYRKINLDCNSLFKKISNYHPISISYKDDNSRRVESKKSLKKKFPIIDKTDDSNNKAKTSVKIDQVHNLQKLYYKLDETDKSKNDLSNIKKFTFCDYANKNIIYNHPQLYLIKRHDNLPKLRNTRFIKFFSLTKNLPEKNNDNIEKKEVEELINYKNMQKKQRSVFYTKCK